MKALFLTLIFAFSSIADMNEEKPEMEFLKKLSKEKVIKENKRIRVSTSKETRAPLKNASPNNAEYESKNVVNKVVVVDQHRKRQDDRISVTEVASDNPFLLGLEFNSKNEMYQVQRLEYKFFKANESSSDLSNMQTIETYDYNAKKRANLDLQPLAPGNYKAVLRLVTHKSNQKNEKVTQEFVFFAEVEFERLKVETAHLVVENYNHPNGNFRSIFRTGDSYSDYGGEITKFTYNIILDGEQYDYLETPFTNIVWIFKAKGIFEIEVTAHDSYGDTDSQNFTLEVTNAAPIINVSITKNQEMAGWVDFDFSGTYDPDGVEIARYVIFLYLLEDGVFRFKRAEFPKGEKFSFPLAGRGTTQICSAALSSTGDYNIKCQTEDHFDNIAPIMRLYRHEYYSNNPSFQNFFTRCNDMDGVTSQLKVRGLAPSGEVREKNLSNYITTFHTPEKGVWRFYFSCFDNDGAASNVVKLEKNIQYDLGQPKGHVELASVSANSSNLVWAPAIAQAEPSPYAHSIINYSYKGLNLDNGDTFKIDHSNPYDPITFPSYGKWKIEYTVKDNLWLVSEPQVFELVVNSFPVANFTFTRPGDKPRTLIFTSQSTDEYGEIVKYSLKATSDAGEVVEKEFIENQFELSFGLGLWSIEITAIDDLGDRSVSPWKGGVLIKNINPVADFTYELNPEKFGKVKFNSKSTDVDGEISSYQLELVNLSTGAVQNHNFASASYEIVLEEADWRASITATDNDGGVSGPWTTTFKIFNEPPIANFSFTKHSTDYNKVLFDSLSSDPDGTVTEYQIYGYNDNGVSLNKVFTTENFSVELDDGYWSLEIIAVDNLGKKSAPWNLGINVVNLNPVAIMNIFLGESWDEYHLNATGSYDPDGYIANYHYTFMHSSGVVKELSTTEILSSIKLGLEGNWNVKLVAMDNYGNFSLPAYRYINLIKPKIIPVANVSCNSEFLHVVCDASSSYDEDGSIVEYIFETEGESFSKLEPQFEFTYTKAGTKTIELTVVDNEGLISEISTQTIEVRVEPQPNALALCALNEYNMLACDGSYSKAFEGQQLVSYQWNIDNQEYEGKEISLPATEDTFYYITLTVYQDDGREDTHALEHHVNALNENIPSQITLALKGNESVWPLASNLEISVDGALSYEVFNQLSFSLNDTDIAPELIYFDGASITIEQAQFKDGANTLEVFGLDENQNEIQLYETIVAGSHRLTISNPQAFSSIILTSFDYEVSFPQNNGSFIYLPSGDYSILAYGDGTFDQKIIHLNNDREMQLNSTSLELSDVDNNSLEQGLVGWETNGDEVALNTKLDPITNEVEDVIQMRPGLNGQAQILRKFHANTTENYLTTKLELVTEGSGTLSISLVNLDNDENYSYKVSYGAGKTFKIYPKLKITSPEDRIVYKVNLVEKESSEEVVDVGFGRFFKAYAQTPAFPTTLSQFRITYNHAIITNMELYNLFYDNGPLPAFSVGHFSERHPETGNLVNFFEKNGDGYNKFGLRYSLGSVNTSVNNDVKLFFFNGEQLFKEAFFEDVVSTGEPFTHEAVSISSLFPPYEATEISVVGCLTNLDLLVDCQEIKSANQDGMFKLLYWQNVFNIFPLFDEPYGGDKWASLEHQELWSEFVKSNMYFNDFSKMNGGDFDHKEHKIGRSVDYRLTPTPKVSNDYFHVSGSKVKYYKLNKLNAVEFVRHANSLSEKILKRLEKVLLNKNKNYLGEELPVEFNDILKGHCSESGILADKLYRDDEKHYNHLHLRFKASSESDNRLPTEEKEFHVKIQVGTEADSGKPSVYPMLYSDAGELLTQDLDKFKLFTRPKNASGEDAFDLQMVRDDAGKPVKFNKLNYLGQDDHRSLDDYYEFYAVYEGDFDSKTMNGKLKCKEVAATSDSLVQVQVKNKYDPAFVISEGTCNKAPLLIGSESDAIESIKVGGEALIFLEESEYFNFCFSPYKLSKYNWYLEQNLVFPAEITLNLNTGEVIKQSLNMPSVNIDYNLEEDEDSYSIIDLNYTIEELNVDYQLEITTFEMFSFIDSTGKLDWNWGDLDVPYNIPCDKNLVLIPRLVYESSGVDVDYYYFARRETVYSPCR